MEITVTRCVRMAHRNRSAARPVGYLYECTGPDGREFSNPSLATLRDVLRRRYGKIALVKGWSAPSADRPAGSPPSATS